MTDEVIADSGTETETSEPTESFDMESAQASISSDLFGSEPKEKTDEPDINEENVEESVENVKEPDKKEATEEEVKEEIKEEIRRNAPESWKKEMDELFSSADPQLQDYIEKREKQMHDGLENDRENATLGRTMSDMLKPYSEMFRQKGIDGTQAVQYLLNAHNALSNGTIEQKQAAIAQLSQSYGITKPEDGENPQVTSLAQRLSQMEMNQKAEAERVRQAQSESIQAEVNAFSKDHPLLDDLSDEIAGFINLGYSLEDAYKKAERSSDGYIESEVERKIKERDEKAEIQRKKEAEEAKKAKSVNIKGRDTNKAPTAPKGKMFDDMNDIYREINNRN